METYPFPLPVNSAHHSHYHRFLLGADPAILSPLPKPACIGRLAEPLRDLAGEPDLPRWRKLYNAAFPWAEGFGPAHYRLGNVPAHRPLPREYARPARRYAGFDFVQSADPSLSALALVAGDRRIISRFVALSADFCAALEPGVAARTPGPDGSRTTGRMLAGLFAEPNNRWLMPFLHVHARVLNFTSFESSARKLDCIDAASLARAGLRARGSWVGRQAALLTDLGYKVAPRSDPAAPLRVEGVGAKVLASLEAPRIAVLRVLERMLLGEHPPSPDRLCSELPPPVVAAMAEQLETLLARSASYYRPPKMGIPSEGPWRTAVREHLGRCCPAALDAVDREARRARAEPIGTTLFATPTLDAAHCHVPTADILDAALQNPADPELGASQGQEPRAAAPRRLLAEFCAALNGVNEAIVRAPASDTLAPLRGPLASVNRLGEGPDAGQLRRAAELLGAEIERESREAAAEEPSVLRQRWIDRVPLATMDRLLAEIASPALVREPEVGGRSL